MTSLRLRIFLMVFLVVVVAVGTVLVFASQGSLMAVQDFVGLSTARDQHMAVQFLSEPLRAGQAPQAQVQQVGAALGACAGHRSTRRGVGRRNQSAKGPGAASAHAMASRQANRAPGRERRARVPGGWLRRRDWHRWQTRWRCAVTKPLSDTLLYFGPQTASADTVFFSAPTSLARLPGGVPAQLALDTINRSLLLAAVAAGGVALLLTGTLSRGIVGPVEALTLAARRMEQGDLSQRVDIQARDEIGALAHAFNAMAEGLSVSEQLRRQMVTDIAHELRTPLTNIRGYLEAVRDGVVAPRPEVIDSLYEESLLLNRLVEDLQELALAEAGQLRLRRRPTAIGEVAEHTLAALPPQAAGALDRRRRVGVSDCQADRGSPRRASQRE